MIEKISIFKYRKMENIDFYFRKKVTAISGTNGTCKSSLLHIISNAFKKIKQNASWIDDKNCIKILNKINQCVNPKIETLTRGDKNYNDPARGHKGNLFSITYTDGTTLNFRRHNTKSSERYAVKPQYKNNARENLPEEPVIYLGIPRLMPYGEFHDNTSHNRIMLPDEYKQIIADLYKQFTTYNINVTTIQKMGDIKTRTEFDSQNESIDSNTISAGEDNLYIILNALISLRYYYHNVTDCNHKNSLLLIDELDATLHPAFQEKLVRLFCEYSEQYCIKIIFTTHSLSCLENIFENKQDVIYICDNGETVFLMEEPDIYKIKMHLCTKTDYDIYADKIIPIFTEDEEARFMLDALLKYYANKNKTFSIVKDRLHLVNASISSSSLRNIFEDPALTRTTMKAICILDGDQKSDLSNLILTLPGMNQTTKHSSLSPERLLIDYIIYLMNVDDFWRNKTLVDKGITKQACRDKILTEIDIFNKEMKRKQQNKESVKGMKRDFYKKIFNTNKTLFYHILNGWLNDDNNAEIIKQFFKNLKIAFKKVSLYNGISPTLWE